MSRRDYASSDIELQPALHIHGGDLLLALALDALVGVGDELRAQELIELFFEAVEQFRARHHPDVDARDAQIQIVRVREQVGTPLRNKAAERVFGYTTAEMIGQSIRIAIPPDRQDGENLVLERLRRGERIDYYETVRRRKDGALIYVSLTTSPVRDREGHIRNVPSGCKASVFPSAARWPRTGQGWWREISALAASASSGLAKKYPWPYWHPSA